MKGVKKCILSRKLFIISVLFLIPFLALLSVDKSFAANVNVSSATVNFWSSSSPEGQVTAPVSLPWDANVGGSASNTQSFYLNSISMIYPITASASETSVYGRLVMRFNPWYTSTSNVYFCDKNLNDYTSSVTGVLTACTASVVFHYSDNTSYTANYPLYFNFSLPSGSLNAYVDYNQSLPNTSLSSVGLILQKTGNFDVYSITNSYSLVLTTLISDASYYTGGGTDLTPLVNQNNVIINQNQQIIDQDNKDRDELQNTSNDAQQDADSAGQQVTQASASLLTIMGNYINIILNPPQSNCEINMSVLFSRYKSGDYGNADLCSLAVPNGWNIIGSFLLIGLLIPFVISTINTFLYLLKGATQD